MDNRRTLTSPVITIVVTLIAVFGIIIGVLASKDSFDSSILSETELFSDDFYITLKNAFLMKLLWSIPLILGGASIFFIPLSPASLFLKCFSYGYTVGAITKLYGSEGYFLLLAGLSLHNFLFTAASVIYSSYGINKTLECFLNRRNYDYCLRKNKLFVIVTVAFLIFDFFLAVGEAYISFFLYDI